MQMSAWHPSPPLLFNQPLIVFADQTANCYFKQGAAVQYLNCSSILQPLCTVWLVLPVHLVYINVKVS